ncbi:hypothetical protein HDU93_004866 [Gonapodya sp. JEL0774]|nr:hypothetical protein HDU93_004866 [Gonapodya sp. JEL0774]
MQASTIGNVLPFFVVRLCTVDLQPDVDPLANTTRTEHPVKVLLGGSATDQVSDAPKRQERQVDGSSKDGDTDEITEIQPRKDPTQADSVEVPILIGSGQEGTHFEEEFSVALKDLHRATESINVLQSSVLRNTPEIRASSKQATKSSSKSFESDVRNIREELISSEQEVTGSIKKFKFEWRDNREEVVRLKRETADSIKIVESALEIGQEEFVRSNQVTVDSIKTLESVLKNIVVELAGSKQVVEEHTRQTEESVNEIRKLRSLVDSNQIHTLPQNSQIQIMHPWMFDIGPASSVVSNDSNSQEKPEEGIKATELRKDPTHMVGEEAFILGEQEKLVRPTADLIKKTETDMRNTQEELARWQKVVENQARQIQGCEGEIRKLRALVDSNERQTRSQHSEIQSVLLKLDDMEERACLRAWINPHASVSFQKLTCIFDGSEKGSMGQSTFGKQSRQAPLRVMVVEIPVLVVEVNAAGDPAVYELAFTNKQLQRASNSSDDLCKTNKDSVDEIYKWAAAVLQYSGKVPRGTPPASRAFIAGLPTVDITAGHKGSGRGSAYGFRQRKESGGSAAGAGAGAGAGGNQDGDGRGGGGAGAGGGGSGNGNGNGNGRGGGDRDRDRDDDHDREQQDEKADDGNDSNTEDDDDDDADDKDDKADKDDKDDNKAEAKEEGHSHKRDDGSDPDPDHQHNQDSMMDPRLVVTPDPQFGSASGPGPGPASDTAHPHLTHTSLATLFRPRARRHGDAIGEQAGAGGAGGAGAARTTGTATATATDTATTPTPTPPATVVHTTATAPPTTPVPAAAHHPPPYTDPPPSPDSPPLPLPTATATAPGSTAPRHRRSAPSLTGNSMPLAPLSTSYTNANPQNYELRNRSRSDGRVVVPVLRGLTPVAVAVGVGVAGTGVGVGIGHRAATAGTGGARGLAGNGQRAATAGAGAGGGRDRHSVPVPVARQGSMTRIPPVTQVVSPTRPAASVAAALRRTPRRSTGNGENAAGAGATATSASTSLLSPQRTVYVPYVKGLRTAGPDEHPSANALFSPQGAAPYVVPILVRGSGKGGEKGASRSGRGRGRGTGTGTGTGTGRKAARNLRLEMDVVGGKGKGGQQGEEQDGSEKPAAGNGTRLLRSLGGLAGLAGARGGSRSTTGGGGGGGGSLFDRVARFFSTGRAGAGVEVEGMIDAGKVEGELGDVRGGIGNGKVVAGVGVGGGAGVVQDQAGPTDSAAAAAHHDGHDDHDNFTRELELRSRTVRSPPPTTKNRSVVDTDTLNNIFAPTNTETQSMSMSTDALVRPPSAGVTDRLPTTATAAPPPDECDSGEDQRMWNARLRSAATSPRGGGQQQQHYTGVPGIVATPPPRWVGGLVGFVDLGIDMGMGGDVSPKGGRRGRSLSTEGCGDPEEGPEKKKRRVVN